MERLDLSELKNKINLVLQDRAIDYWDALQKFIYAKLSKREFDDIVKRLLPEQQVVLHNTFIKTLLRNAYCPQPPPSLRQRHGASSSTKKSSSKSKKKKKHSKSGHEAREEKFQMPRNPFTAIPPRMAPRKVPPAIYSRPTDPQAPSAPLFIALRTKMLRTAVESGITDVAQESVSLMMHALEYQLKQLLSSCSTLVKTRRAAAAAGGHLSPNSLSLLATPATTTRDLQATIDLSPHLLGDEFVLNQERVSMLV